MSWCAANLWTMEAGVVFMEEERVKALPLYTMLEAWVWPIMLPICFF